MAWSILRLSGPIVPLTTAEIKLQVRIDHAVEDTLIDRWAKSAIALAEDYCGKRWQGDFRISFDDWPLILELPVEPVSAVTAVKYTDADGVEQTLAAEAYQTWLDHSPPLLAPVADTDWPEIADVLAPVRIEVSAGLTVPEEVMTAMLLTIGYWEENRGGEPGQSPVSLGLPAGAKRLLDFVRSGSYR